MTDIVGNETLRDLWQSVVDRRGDRQFLTFHNRWEIFLNIPILSLIRM